MEAQVDASGPAAGGTILIGGDYQGKNAAMQNARLTYVGPNATLNVDALESGAGGRAIVWADQSTYFAGTLTARGGINGGDGGFVETSGKGTLIVRRAPDVAARRNAMRWRSRLATGRQYMCGRSPPLKMALRLITR